MCLRGSRFKKHIIFHILYIIVAPLCPAILKRTNFYKAHRSEKRGVLWMASYPVRCDWLNTSSVWRKCYAPSHVVMPCPGVVPNSDPCQIITPPVLVGLGLGVGEGLGLRMGLGLGNQIVISTRGVIIWQGVENSDPARLLPP